LERLFVGVRLILSLRNELVDFALLPGFRELDLFCLWHAFSLGKVSQL
jgi:hypothetical protein